MWVEEKRRSCPFPGFPAYSIYLRSFYPMTLGNCLRLLVFAITFGLLPGSCDNCIPENSCDCMDMPEKREFEILAMDLRPDLLENPGSWDANRYYPADSLVWHLTIDERRRVSYSGFRSGRGFSLGSTLWACSPLPPQPINRIEEIRISNRKALRLPNQGDSIAVGEDITGLFRFAVGYISPYTRWESDTAVSWSSFKDQLAIRAALRFREPTVLLADVEVVLDDGRRFSFSKQQMNLHR